MPWILLHFTLTRPISRAEPWKRRNGGTKDRCFDTTQHSTKQLGERSSTEIEIEIEIEITIARTR